jgi:hypothetical protein
MAAHPRRPVALVRGDRAAPVRAERRRARRRAGARRRRGHLAPAAARARRWSVLRRRCRPSGGGIVVLGPADRVQRALSSFRSVRLALAGIADGPTAGPARAQHGALDLRRCDRSRRRPACAGGLCLGGARVARALRDLRLPRARARPARRAHAGRRPRRRTSAAPGRLARAETAPGVPLAVSCSSSPTYCSTSFSASWRSISWTKQAPRSPQAVWRSRCGRGQVSSARRS